jgi:tripartite-type tricarboxylate transporter receptor subunit TctC
MISKSMPFLTACIVLSGSVFDCPAIAQSEFPNRAIKLVVPVPPGPILDTLPRIIAEKLSLKWKQPVIIENRPGAAQNLGADVVYKSAPDGYTLLVTPAGPLTISPHLFSKLGFDPAAFVPVSLLVTIPAVFVVNSKLPLSTFQDFVALAKANPGKITYGTPGRGSSPHLATEMLMNATGIRLVHVPFNGFGPALNNLLGGHIDVMIDNLGNVASSIENGSLRVLGATTKTRIPELPNVPAIAETHPGFDYTSWFAIVAPPRTSPEIATKLSQGIAEALKLPDVERRFRGFSVAPVGSSPAETAAFIGREHELWRKLIQANQIKLD